jgi:ribosomal protein S13
MALLTKIDQIPDWVSPLEKNYKKQSDQREKFRLQNVEVDKQRLAKSSTLDNLTDIVGSLSSLSKTANKLNKEIQTRKQTDFSKKWYELDSTQRDVIQQVVDENDLSKKGSNLINLLKDSKAYKDGELTDQQIAWVERNSGHKSLLLKRQLGWQAVQGSISYTDDLVENDENAQFEYDKAEKNSDVENWFYQTTLGRLRRMGLNDVYIDTHFEPELRRLSNTKGLSKQLEYKVVKNIKDTDEITQQFSNYKFSSNEDPVTNELVANAFQRVLNNNIKKDPVKGRENTIIYFHQLMKKGEINSAVIDAIQTGKITDKEANQAGFKLGKNLISDDDWKWIRQGEQEYLTEKKRQHDVKYADRATSIESGILDERVSPEELKNFLVEAKNNGQEDKDWYKRLEKFNPSAQNSEVFQKSDKEYNTSKFNGTLHNREKEIKEHPNVNIQKKYGPLAERVNTFINNHPSTFGKLDKVLENFVYETRTGNSLENNTISEDDGFVVGELRRFTYQRLYHYLEQELQGAEPIDNLDRVIKDERDAYWEANGGGLEGENDKTPPGMFSRVRKNGNLQWANIGVVLRESSNLSYDHNYKSPNKLNNYTTKVNSFGNISKQERWEKPNGIYTRNQLLGLRDHLYFSEAMIYDAKMDGLLPGQAYNKAIEALEKSDSKDDKDFLKRNNLKKWEFDGKKEAPDERLNNILTAYTEAIENTPTSNLNTVKIIKDLQSRIRWYGFDSLSMKHRQLLYNILEQINPTDQVRNEAVADRARLEKEQKKAEEDSNLERYKQGARIKQNKTAKNIADQTGIGTQEYFRGTDNRTDEELDEQFNEFNTQPGIF